MLHVSGVDIFYIALGSLPVDDARDTSRRDVQRSVAICKGE